MVHAARPLAVMLTAALLSLPAAAQTPYPAPPGSILPGGPASGWPPLREQVPPPPGRLPVPLPEADGGYARPLPPQYYPLPHERRVHPDRRETGACPPWPDTSSACWYRRR